MWFTRLGMASADGGQHSGSNPHKFWKIRDSNLPVCHTEPPVFDIHSGFVSLCLSILVPDSDKGFLG